MGGFVGVEGCVSILSYPEYWGWVLMSSDRDLIYKHANRTARDPRMWGGQEPHRAHVEQLAGILKQQWTAAVERLLRSWEGQPPTMSGEW